MTQLAAPPSAVVPPEVAPVESPQGEPSATAEPAEPEKRPPWEGPFLGITRSSAGIYSEPTFARSKKIAYAQEAARVPVHEDTVAKDDCSEGWYRVVDGGYICGNHGTTKLDDPRIKLGKSQPNLDEILPYRYARNTKNGTPLYKSVPSKEQIRIYEPYLFPDEPKKKAKAGAEKPKAEPEVDEQTRLAREDQARRMAALRAARRAMLGEDAVEDEEAKTEKSEKRVASPAPEKNADKSETAPDAGAEGKHWWKEDDPELHKLTMDDLTKEGDDVLSSRLVKGFYIAVDKVFDWNKRRWFKSTKGFVAPAERFHFASGSDFKGVELDDDDDWKLPVGWVHGWKKSKPKFSLADDGKSLKPAGPVKRFEAVNLTGKEQEFAGKTYLESVDGFWIRDRDVRVTKPGPPPAEVGPTEVWVDVNLDTQTLVAFRGTEPFYATLISSGKTHRDKEKDHRTPTGQWRVREKHITATMDGDGTAAGDLPYSIEGVPYVMYFHKAYALHGAFWHRNYGTQMSHGCVNLAPLDAKYLFFETAPAVEEGWHGAWSSEDRPGSLVAVHE